MTVSNGSRLTPPGFKPSPFLWQLDVELEQTEAGLARLRMEKFMLTEPAAAAAAAAGQARMGGGGASPRNPKSTCQPGCFAHA